MGWALVRKIARGKQLRERAQNRTPERTDKNNSLPVSWPIKKVKRAGPLYFRASKTPFLRQGKPALRKPRPRFTGGFGPTS